MGDTKGLSWRELGSRKASLPSSRSTSLIQNEVRPRGKSVPNPTPFPAADKFTRPRGLQSVSSMSTGKARRRRKVTFKNMYTPDVVPPPKVESYDELVFTVAGLFHTTSFLHDPEDWGDDPASSTSSADDFYDPEPPLERSVPLMIAEFLYRSAVFLGYPQGETPWLPGFREDKRFSGNDVKRWRRLAHFDWEAEERAFQKKCAKSALVCIESVSHTTSSSYQMRRHESLSSFTSGRSQDSSGSSRTSIRSAVSGWIHKYRHFHSKNHLAAQVVDDEEARKSEERRRRKPKPVSWLNPPLVSPTQDLSLLVDIVNSCVYCGQFQFRACDILRLANVKI